MQLINDYTNQRRGRNRRKGLEKNGFTGADEEEGRKEKRKYFPLPRFP